MDLSQSSHFSDSDREALPSITSWKPEEETVRPLQPNFLIETNSGIKELK